VLINNTQGELKKNIVKFIKKIKNYTMHNIEMKTKKKSMKKVR
jgi:hypothetical protein